MTKLMDLLDTGTKKTVSETAHNNGKRDMGRDYTKFRQSMYAMSDSQFDLKDFVKRSGDSGLISSHKKLEKSMGEFWKYVYDNYNWD